MKDDQRAIYRSTLLELARDRRYCGALDNATQSGQACNPLCGDEIRVQARIDDEGKISDLKYVIRGCAVCAASARLLAEHATGRAQDELDGAVLQLQAALNGEALSTALETVRPLLALEHHPARHPCVLLPWQALAESWVHRQA